MQPRKLQLSKEHRLLHHMNTFSLIFESSWAVGGSPGYSCQIKFLQCIYFLQYILKNFHGGEREGGRKVRETERDKILQNDGERWVQWYVGDLWSSFL